MSKNSKFKLIVAAGGTGGHLFPAIAVVQKLEELTNKNIEVKFIGTTNHIESKVAPGLGYELVTIPICGYDGLFSLKTLSLPFKILKSIKISRKLIRSFKPLALLCTGAYISYPAGIAAYKEKVPIILMESNVNPGKTISILAKKAEIIITSFEVTKKFFKDDIKTKIRNYGNPVRENLFNLPSKEKAREKFGLNANMDTVLVFGGSLGAMTINRAVENVLSHFKDKNIQFLWQTGKEYLPELKKPAKVKIIPFIDDMASAYSAADLVVSRSGATTVAEIAVCGKPSILIPLSSASNNEQEENARIFQKEKASVMLLNSEADEKLSGFIEKYIADKNLLNEMAKAAGKLSKPHAAEEAAKIILEIIQSKA